MIVEILSFDVPASEREAWCAADASTWTRFLEMQAGFVRKEVWADARRPDELTLLVWWEDEASWKRVPAAARRAVDEAMGPWYRPVRSVRAMEIVR